MMLKYEAQIEVAFQLQTYKSYANIFIDQKANHYCLLINNVLQIGEFFLKTNFLFTHFLRSIHSPQVSQSFKS